MAIAFAIGGKNFFLHLKTNGMLLLPLPLIISRRFCTDGHMSLDPKAQRQLLADIYEACQHANIIVGRVEINNRLGRGDSHEGEEFELVCYSHGKGPLLQVIDTIRTLVGVKSVQFEADEVP
jgi:hypothetical protein